MFLSIDYSEVKAMTHFGILCLEATGHLNAIFPLGRELQRRGHCVTVFSGSGAQTQAQAAGFNFCDIYSAGDRKPGGETQTPSAKVEKLRGLASIRYTLQKFAQYSSNQTTTSSSNHKRTQCRRIASRLLCL